MNIERRERQEREPVVETVRGAIFHRGKFLILQKEAGSKNPAALEFPGGKIDEVAGSVSNPEEQLHALEREVSEETGIDIRGLSAQKIDEFLTYFETGSPEARRAHRRRVHLFLVRVPDAEDMRVGVNETHNEQGVSEDKHAGYRWASPEELAQFLALEENPVTQKRGRPLARNSRHIKKLLDAVRS